jgi:hypothetical protein
MVQAAKPVLFSDINSIFSKVFLGISALLLYTVELISVFIHQLFYQNSSSNFLCLSALFCTDCIFIYFLILSYVLWSSQVQHLAVLKHLISTDYILHSYLFL